MIKHLCKIVWNRKRSNFLISVEIFISFLVVFAVMVFAVYYADNYRRPLGFNYENVWSVSANIRGASEPLNRSQEVDTSRRLLAALREFPEVVSAANAWSAPYSSGNWTTGRTDKKRGININFNVNQVSDDLPAVLGIILARGRWFGREDDGANYKPVVINRQLSRDLFGDDDPIGKDISDPDEKERVEQRVVGLIDDFRKDGEFAEARGYVFERNNLVGSTSHPPRSFVIKVQPGTTVAFEEKLLARLQSEAKDWSFSVKPLSEMRAEAFNQYLAPISAFALVAGFLMDHGRVGIDRGTLAKRHLSDERDRGAPGERRDGGQHLLADPRRIIDPRDLRAHRRGPRRGAVPVARLARLYQRTRLSAESVDLTHSRISADDHLRSLPEPYGDASSASRSPPL